MAFLAVQNVKTLLHLAAKAGDTERAALLLSGGAFINAVDEVWQHFGSWTALQYTPAAKIDSILHATAPMS